MCFFERGDVVDDFGVESIPFRSHLSIGNVECHEVRQSQQWATQDVAIVHIPRVCEALRTPVRVCLGEALPR